MPLYTRWKDRKHNNDNPIKLNREKIHLRTEKPILVHHSLLGLTWLLLNWAVFKNTESSLWPEAGCVQLQLSSALGVLYLRLLGKSIEFLPSLHLEWTLECYNYKINPHTCIQPKYGKLFINNIVFVCWNTWA